MDRRDNDSSQRSSLPRSLIPHLYNAPQTSRDSSTRTTLPEHEDGEEGEASSQEQALFRQSSSSFVLRPILADVAPASSSIQPRRYPARHPIYEDISSLRNSPSPSFSGNIRRHSVGPPISVSQGPPIRSDPAYYTSIARQAQGPQQDYLPPPMDVPSQLPYMSGGSMWREGEAGPSSMASAFHYSDQRGFRRDPGYPLRSPRPDSFRYTERPGEYRQDFSRHPMTRDYIESRPGYSAYNQGQPHGLDPILAPLPLTRRVPDLMLYGGNPREEQDQYSLPSLPPLSSSSGSSQRVWSVGDTSSSSGAGDYSSGYPSSLPPITPPRGSTTDPDDSDPDYTPQKYRKRRKSSTAQESGRAKAGKKTLIACDFCRGRKLRCDGTRPSCFNCKSRENQVCVYQPYPRRRGPGKASKGAKAKRKAAAEKARTSELLIPSSEFRQQEIPGSTFDMERIALGTQASAGMLPLPHVHLDPSLAGAPYTIPPDDDIINSDSRSRQHRSRTERESDSEEKFIPRRN